MITIEYTAKRKLKAGVTIGDVISITIPVDNFALKTVIDESTNTAVGGAVQVSLKHYFDSWNIKTVYDSVNTKEDYEQFLYSVLGGVPFTITDYDDSDTVKNVIMQGSFNRDRIRAFNAGEFNYSFQIREI